VESWVVHYSWAMHLSDHTKSGSFFNPFSTRSKMYILAFSTVITVVVCCLNLMSSELISPMTNYASRQHLNVTACLVIHFYSHPGVKRMGRSGKLSIIYVRSTLSPKT
jgi:hypothetical protein